MSCEDVIVYLQTVLRGSDRGFECYRLWVLKKSVIGMSFCCDHRAAADFFLLTSAKW